MGCGPSKKEPVFSINNDDSGKDEAAQVLQRAASSHLKGNEKAKDDAALLLQKAASMHLGAVHKPPSESKKADHTQYSFAPNGRMLDEASRWRHSSVARSPQPLAALHTG